MSKFIPVNEPLLDGNEKKYLIECIESGWISSEGPFVGKLEEGMAAYVGRKYGIAVCNGTAALEIAVNALPLGQGDEVIMPAFTIISCAAALVKKGIKPVLVDCYEDTWNMNVSEIESKITDKTKAIMVVHIYGMPVDMDVVLDIAQRHNLFIIEDAAEAHGLQYKGKMCGSFGDISIMSFYPNKHVTTGEGGIVLTDSNRYAERCKSLRNLCFKPERRFVHDELGYNYRMSNIQAAVGVAQLEKIEQHIQKKYWIGQKYTELLGGNDQYDIPIVEKEYAHNIYWVFSLVIHDDVKLTAADAINKLAELGVGCRPFFYPMNLQPVFNKMGLFINECYPVAERIAEKGFYLPSGLNLDEEKIEYITEQVKRIFI